jgi:hypothetical protein
LNDVHPVRRFRETSFFGQADEQLKHLVMGPEVVVGSVHNNFDDKLYRDESGLNFMMESLGKLRAEILARRPVAA